MVYENPVGQGGHCPEPVTWVGWWKFFKGWPQGVQASGTPTSCHLPEGLKVEFLGRVVPFKHLG
jgi:hypothetical protein